MSQVPELNAGALAGKAAGTRRSAWLFSWPLLMGIGVYLLFLRHAKNLLQDGDTFWHIATGRWIMANGAVPASDPFSHTMRGAPWTAQEWLSEVVLATAHQLGGWALVVALVAFAFAVTIALLTRALLRWLEPVHVLLIVVLAVLMAAGHVLARPHMLAMPLLMLWTIELVRAADSGRAPRWWMLPLMTLWANLHGGFTLGIALAGVFALEALLVAWRQQRIGPAARAWVPFVALAVAFSMATPNGWNGLVFTWQVMTDHGYTLARVGEWRSPDFQKFQPLELWLLGGLALVMYQGLRLPPVRLFLLLVLLHLALKHIRNVELVGLLAPLFMAAPFAAQWHERQQSRQQFDSADRVFRKLAQPAGAGAVLATLAMAVTLPLWVLRAAPLELPENVAPVRAVEAARNAGIEGPVFNTYDWGGYLIYMGIAPFIDGRADIYRDAFIKAYVEAHELRAPDSLQQLLDKYRVTWTLLKPESSAVAMLDHLPQWRRVYADQNSVVHARRER